MAEAPTRLCAQDACAKELRRDNRGGYCSTHHLDDPARRARKNKQLRERRREERALLPKVTLMERLLGKVDQRPDGCWTWLGAVSSSGYGVVSAEGRKRSAHCVTYEQTVGPIPDGMVLDHLCHTLAVRAGECEGGPVCRHRRCVNPEHLEPVTDAENCRRGVRGQKTHCPAGHAYVDSNTYINRLGRRVCRTCMRARDLAARERIQQAVAAAQFREPK